MIFVELNEAELIERELTVRDLRVSREVLETRRSAARWLALTLGIINPGESRLSAVAVLDAVIYFQFVKKQDPTVKDLVEYITTSWEPINEKTLRYHLLRMKKMGFIDNEQSKFYFRPPSFGDRFDPYVWSTSMFDLFYKNISKKLGDVINDLKEKEKIM